jgi:hypothetical protein
MLHFLLDHVPFIGTYLDAALDTVGYVINGAQYIAGLWPSP